MYNDRVEVSGERMMAGLSANDNRAQAKGPAAWGGPVREEKMRFDNKFLDGDAEGSGSFNPIAHVEVKGNQGAEVRARVLREQERYASSDRIVQQQASERSIWMSASEPYTAKSSFERLVAETDLAFVDEPVQPSDSNREWEPAKGGVPGNDYWVSHHALDRRLMPQRMPIPGYAGHIRRTHGSTVQYGTSKWKPASPPSRAAQAFAAYENARQKAIAARRPADFKDNDPFAGMDGKQGTAAHNVHVQPGAAASMKAVPQHGGPSSSEDLWRFSA